MDKIHRTRVQLIYSLLYNDSLSQKLQEKHRKKSKKFLMIQKNGIVHSWRLKEEHNNFLNVLKAKKLGNFERILNKLEYQNKWYLLQSRALDSMDARSARF